MRRFVGRFFMAHSFLSQCLMIAGLCLSLNVSAAIPNMDAGGNAMPSLAPMIERVNPAVVNISTYSKQQQVQNPLLNDPFFRRFFNVPEQQQQQKSRPRQRSAGSGVIVHAEKGTVITNYHVIAGADEIHVTLDDGRNFEAELLGSDPEVDIAILKIKAKKLTALVMADSDQIRVGDFVVAIGNPFGLKQTVTTGIVSALGRTGLNIEGYEDFIQTDASINPGNSGGALINLRGELVGINTAIIAPAGGNVGIGFAIPANMAAVSMQQILEHGEVKRGQLGIGIQDVTQALRKSFELENGQNGVLITSVAEKSEAEKAGLQVGDVILSVDGKATPSTGALRSAIGQRSIGDKVKIEIIRDGKKKTIRSKIGEPQNFSVKTGKLHPLLEGARFENNSDGRGVVVTQITRGSEAAASGLRQGDIILGANRTRTDDVNDFGKALELDDKSILLHIQRGAAQFYLVLQ